MGDHNKKVSLGEADNHIVKPDKESPRFNRAVKVLARLVLAERAAMLAKTQALDLRGSDGEGPATGLWGEMPRVAKEHEASLGADGDGILSPDEP